MADSVAKVPKCLATNFSRKDETTTIANRCVLNRDTEVAGEFVTGCCGPPHEYSIVPTLHRPLLTEHIAWRGAQGGGRWRLSVRAAGGSLPILRGPLSTVKGQRDRIANSQRVDLTIAHHSDRSLTNTGPNPHFEVVAEMRECSRIPPTSEW